MPAHAEITKSRSKKKPFKVVIIAENGEPLQSAQLFTTRRNCITNLMAVMDAFHGNNILVVDSSGKEEIEIDLKKDGYEVKRIFRGAGS